METVIIGGGLIGVATLYELASRGVEALLLEAAEDVALGTSFANGALLTPSMSDPWNSPGVARHLLASLFDPASALKLSLPAAPFMIPWGLEFLRNATPARHGASTAANFRLARYSRGLTLDLVRELGLQIDANTRGALKVFDSEASMAGPLALARGLEPLGLAYTVLDAQGAVAVEPRLADIAPRISGAIHYPDDSVGDARKFTMQLSAAAQQAKGGVRLRARVVSVARQGDGSFKVETPDETLIAKRLVLAAGHATPRLARRLGVRLPIKPAKGYSLTFDGIDPAAAPTTTVIDDALHAAVVPLGRRIRVAGTAEFAGEDLRVDPRRIENLAELLKRIYPSMAEGLDGRTGEGWAGLRPMSADGRPFIGETALTNLWVNAGHGHLGWTMAAGSARLLAQQMTRRPTDIDSAPFALRGRRL